MTVVRPKSVTTVESAAALRPEEVLIHVYWTGLVGRDDSEGGHRLQRGKVSADLGFVPKPPLSDAEMQEITHAAKMQAIRCVRKRPKPKKISARAAAKTCIVGDFIEYQRERGGPWQPGRFEGPCGGNVFDWYRVRSERGEPENVPAARLRRKP